MRVSHTHLYPGLTLRLPAEQCVLFFSDGTEANASVEGDAAAALLRVAPYITAAGTRIGERLWSLRSLQRDEEELELVLGPRLPAAES